MDKIYITGHKNPDTDSICAAIAYANLKNRSLDEDVEAIRLGEINQETKFVLDYFGVDAPRLKTSIKSQVRDLNMDKAYCISQNISLYKALQIMQENGINSLPVIDDGENLIGIVSLSNITKCYMEVWDDRILGTSQTHIENIIEVLSAKFVHKPDTIKDIVGRIVVYAMDPHSVKNYINEEDIVIVGNRIDAQMDALKKNISLMIVTGGFETDPKVIEEAKARNIGIISTNFNTFMCARLIPQAVPVSHVMTTGNLVTFNLDDTVDEARNTMSKSRFRAYPVLDHRNKVVGSISRYHVISSIKKKLILVDHNEKNQSIDDIDSAEILEIVDHHRVANISTHNPVYFRNEPVGSTCTIISKMFFESGIMPSKQIAGILSAAIISDTLLFKSPTATDVDRIVLERMAKIAGIDIEKFAMEMFKEATKLETKSLEDLVNGDVKKFVVDKNIIRVCQIFTMDLDSLSKIKDGLLEKMEQIRIQNKEATFVIIMTDIFKEISEVIVVGSYKEALASAFGKKIEDNSFIVEGLLSRKKQFIPKLNQAIEENNVKF